MNAKRMALLAVLLPAFGVSLLQAQLVSGRFVTSFYTWKQFDTVGASAAYLRAFQTVQLSVAQGDVALHTNIQGVTNFAKEFGEVGRVRFVNLYLTWANIGKALDLSLGRQAVYAGVANGNIDGVRATARFGQDHFRITGFAGATVSEEFTGIRKNFHDNLSFGGQFITTVVRDLRLGLSYLNRNQERDPYWALRARDTTFAAVPYYVATDSPAEQYGSVDAYYTSTTLFTVYGRYDYDFNLSQTFRGQGSARVNVTPSLALTGDYIYRSPRVLYNSIFSVFPLNTVTELEGGVEYAFKPTLRAFAKYGYVKYSDDKSNRWTLGVNTAYGSLSYSGSGGYAGQLQSVSLQGAYPLLGRMVTPTLGVSYASYRLSAEAPRENALAVLLGATLRPVPAFSVDVQGQWLANRFYNNDTRLQVRLMYWFAERLSIFRQEVNQ